MPRYFSLWILAGCAGATVDTADSDTSPATVEVTAASFPCLTSMSPVRRFYVDNLIGDLDATLAVANDPQGKTWPVGSLIQLLPAEAMVKREAGFSAATNDWEFFALDIDASGTQILTRGADAVNGLGDSCFSCHAKASAEYDFVCEQDHGCDPLSFDDAAILALQDLDPRCGG